MGCHSKRPVAIQVHEAFTFGAPTDYLRGETGFTEKTKKCCFQIRNSIPLLPFLIDRRLQFKIIEV